MMDGFERTEREAELMGESTGRQVECQTYYRPEDALFEEPADFTPVEVEFIDGEPQRCYCGTYKEPNPEAEQVETCLQCDQGALF